MKTETLNLNPANGATTAYVARPDGDATAVVLLIQEWWGINDHIRDIAGRYASEGYICVAPDLYRGKLAKDSTEAAKLMHDLPIEDGLETIEQQSPKQSGPMMCRRLASPVTAWAGRLPCARPVR